MNKQPTNEFTIEDTNLSGDEHLFGIINGKPIEINENYKFFQTNIFIRIFDAILLFILRPILAIIAFLFYGLRVKGYKNVKLVKKQGCVSIANHVLPIDSPLVACVPFWNRKVYFPTIRQNFEIPFTNRLIRALGAWPIPLTLSGNKKFLNSVNIALQSKKVVHMMPEGALWAYYNKLRPFKNGAFRFAITNDVPVLPIVYTFRKSKGVLRLLGKKILVTMTILPPVKASDFDSKDEKIITEQMNTYCSNQMQAVIDKEQSINGFDLKKAYEKYLERNTND